MSNREQRAKREGGKHVKQYWKMSGGKRESARKKGGRARKKKVDLEIDWRSLFLVHHIINVNCSNIWCFVTAVTTRI